MKRKLFILICLLLASCNLPGEQTTSAPQAWFDMPLPDTVFYPPNPCSLITHGASAGGISTFEVSLNGAIASTSPASNSKGKLSTLNTNCPPLVPGKNIIEVRVQDNAGLWSDSAQTIVYLLEADSAIETPPPPSTETPASTLTAVPTLTKTPVPTSTATLTPTPLPTGGVTIERVSTNLVYLGDDTCGIKEVTILARATAPKGIKVVVLFYRFDSADASSEFRNTGMKSIGGDLYEVTLNPTLLMDGAIPFEMATLQYQVVIQQSDGDTSLRTKVNADIAVQACGRVTASCSSYSDERTCIANGCNWVSIPGIVPSFACRRP
ncbi:MAG: hypothetical protein HY864_18505 [Chloroflexi bacterium]|nr:hypothetical protein [Chloroflexota bacterium]